MLSILTNFGCHWGCRYCVYRENGINIPHTDIRTFGWDELELELSKRQGECISISGGGDPLYNYQKSKLNKLWYDRLFELLDKHNCTLEMHTSFLIEDFPYYKCERVVFHLTMPTQIQQVNRRLYNLPKAVRVVFVVQDYYSEGLINYITRTTLEEDNAVNELSFRQCIGSNGETKYYCHDILKTGHMALWYYIEQNDYNDYFVGNGLQQEYLKIK
jgi:organic radical activating enzyme